MPADRNGDYKVGYKRPPLETRFKKGNKANPHGRPRGSKNLATLLDRALDAPVVVVEDGIRRTFTKRDIVIAQLVERSAGADLRATKILLDMLRNLGGGAPSPETERAEAEDVYAQLRTKLARLAETLATEKEDDR